MTKPDRRNVMVEKGANSPYQLSLKGLAPPERKVLTHRQQELARRKWRVANRKRVAKLLA